MSQPAPPAPTASGTLERRPLVHLLVYVLERGLSGTIELCPPDQPKTSLVFAAGCITKEGATDGAPATGSLTDRVGNLFMLPLATEFAYFDGFDALPSTPAEPLPPLQTIWRALVQAPPAAHVQAAVARARSGRLRRTAIDASTVAAEMGRDAGTIVGLLEGGPRSFDDVSAGLTAPDAIVELLLYALLLLKRVEIVAAVGAQAVSMPPTSTPDLSAPAPAPSEEIPEPPPSSGSVNESTPVARVRLKKPVAVGIVAEEKSHLSKHDPRVSTGFDPKAVETGLRARREEVLARAKSIDEEDYFQMLGVPRDATTGQVQTAFISLAKTWHPDKLPPPLNDIRDACARVFGRMSEAQATLVDPARRTDYMRLLTEGGATPKDQDQIADVLEATTAFQKAEILLRRNQNAEAEAHARRAVELDPKQADYHALLAWLEAIKPENQSPDATRARIAMLAKAIDQNPKCERAFFYRAMLYKRLKDDKAALSDFRIAAELNPRNVDAQREVRLFEMRASGKSSPSIRPDAKKAEPAAKGLFGRFFKK